MIHNEADSNLGNFSQYIGDKDWEVPKVFDSPDHDLSRLDLM